MSNFPPPYTHDLPLQGLEYIEYFLEPASGETLARRIDVLSEQGAIGRASEDRIYADANRSLAGVFDGASSIVVFETEDGQTGGVVAASIAVAVLERSTEQQSLREILLAANSSIDEVQHAHGIDPTKKEARFCTTAAVARVRESTDGSTVIDLAQAADSVAIIVYEDGRAEAPLGLCDQDEETLQLWAQLAAKGLRGNEIRYDPQMEAQITRKRQESNVTYGVLNGEPEVANFIQTTTIPAQGVEMVILLDDGLFIPKTDPSAPHDWAVYAQLIAEGGLPRLHQYIRSIERSDPDLSFYPRVKMSDDASGAVLYLR